MALEYKMPIMTCDGVEEPVEHVWAKYNNAKGAIREHYFHELTLHVLFYPCDRLRSELQKAALSEGYKRYENTLSESGDWGDKQLPNYIFVSEVEYHETNFTTSKLEKKKAEINLKLLYGWIINYFRPNGRKKYEWFALWLLLLDKNLLKNNDITLFAKQMVTWFSSLFPAHIDDEVKSLAKAMRIYNRILGDDADKWDNNAILSVICDPRRGAGASKSGYNQIKKIFFDLRSQLYPQKIILKESSMNV